MGNVLMLKRKGRRKRRIKILFFKIVIGIVIAIGVFLFLKQMNLMEEKEAISWEKGVAIYNSKKMKNYLTCRSSCGMIYLRQMYYDNRSKRCEDFLLGMGVGNNHRKEGRQGGYA